MTDMIYRGELVLQAWAGDGRNFDDELLIQVAAYRMRVEKGLVIPDEQTRGPLDGGFLLQSENHEKRTRIWSFGMPAAVYEEPSEGENLSRRTVVRRGTVTATGDFRVVEGREWSDLDPVLDPVDAKIPDGLELPKGWPVVLHKSAYLKDQRMLALPGFAGIMAPHFEGIRTVGTPVYDGTLDEKRRARFQSLARTYRLPGAGCGVDWGSSKERAGLALQLGQARDGMAGYGMVASGPGPTVIPPTRPKVSGLGVTVERPRRQTVSRIAGQVLASMSIELGGFLDVGDDKDQHLLARTPDGEPINSAHISTRAYYRGDGGDGPRTMGGAWVPPSSAPFLTQTFERWRTDRTHQHPCGTKRGKWDLEGTCYFAVTPPPDRTDPPPVDHPPVTPPPPRVPPPVTPPPDDLPPPIPPLGPGDPLPPTPPPAGPGKVNVIPGHVKLPDGTIVNPYPWIVDGVIRDVRPVYTPLEIQFAAQAGRPQHFRRHSVDLRYAAGDPAAHIVAWERIKRTPVVIRHEYFGKQKTTSWEYTTRPGTDRYPGGTGPGGVVEFPPEHDISNFENTNITTSETYRIWCGVKTAWGCPDTSTGKVKDGWSVSSEGASSGWSLSHVDASGTATEVLNQTQTLLDLSGNTGGLLPPTGTTGERNGAPGDGELRWNSTTTELEHYNGSAWAALVSGAGGVIKKVTISALSNTNNQNGTTTITYTSTPTSSNGTQVESEAVTVDDNATNRLLVGFIVNMSSTASATPTAALLWDQSSNAIGYQPGVAGAMQSVVVTADVNPTASSHTFYLRIGKSGTGSWYYLQDNAGSALASTVGATFFALEYEP